MGSFGWSTWVSRARALFNLRRGESSHTLSVGDMIIDLPMVNQDGKTIRFEQFKGKLVLLTFIYTRCPFPDYCPLLTRQLRHRSKRNWKKIPRSTKKLTW